MYFYRVIRYNRPSFIDEVFVMADIFGKYPTVGELKSWAPIQDPDWDLYRTNPKILLDRNGNKYRADDATVRVTFSKAALVATVSFANRIAFTVAAVAALSVRAITHPTKILNELTDGLFKTMVVALSIRLVVLMEKNRGGDLKRFGLDDFFTQFLRVPINYVRVGILRVKLLHLRTRWAKIETTRYQNSHTKVEIGEAKEKAIAHGKKTFEDIRKVLSVENATLDSTFSYDLQHAEYWQKYVGSIYDNILLKYKNQIFDFENDFDPNIAVMSDIVDEEESVDPTLFERLQSRFGDLLDEYGDPRACNDQLDQCIQMVNEMHGMIESGELARKLGTIQGERKLTDDIRQVERRIRTTEYRIRQPKAGEEVRARAAGVFSELRKQLNAVKAELQAHQSRAKHGTQDVHEDLVAGNWYDAAHDFAEQVFDAEVKKLQKGKRTSQRDLNEMTPVAYAQKYRDDLIEHVAYKYNNDRCQQWLGSRDYKAVQYCAQKLIKDDFENFETELKKFIYEVLRSPDNAGTAPSDASLDRFIATLKEKALLDSLPFRLLYQLTNERKKAFDQPIEGIDPQVVLKEGIEEKIDAYYANDQEKRDRLLSDEQMELIVSRHTRLWKEQNLKSTFARGTGIDGYSIVKRSVDHLLTSEDKCHVENRFRFEQGAAHVRKTIQPDVEIEFKERKRKLWYDNGPMELQLHRLPELQDELIELKIEMLEKYREYTAAWDSLNDESQVALMLNPSYVQGVVAPPPNHDPHLMGFHEAFNDFQNLRDKVTYQKELIHLTDLYSRTKFKYRLDERLKEVGIIERVKLHYIWKAQEFYAWKPSYQVRIILFEGTKTGIKIGLVALSYFCFPTYLGGMVLSGVVGVGFSIGELGSKTLGKLAYRRVTYIVDRMPQVNVRQGIIEVFA